MKLHTEATPTHTVPQIEPTIHPYFDFSSEPYNDKHWRATKLAQANIPSERLMVSVQNPAQLSAAEKNALQTNCRDHNLSFYRLNAPCNPPALLTFWQQLGLTNLVTNPETDDYGVSHIQVKPDSRYIPYTDQALLWHTDGYYNVAEKTIRALAMHCIYPAALGGENYSFDSEIMYILLHDENPEYIEALAHPSAMTIPANNETNTQYRAKVSTPMLS